MPAKALPDTPTVEQDSAHAGSHNQGAAGGPEPRTERFVMKTGVNVHREASSLDSRLRRRLLLGALTLAAASWSGPALADAAGDATLAKVDASLNKAKTLYFTYDVIDQAPGKAERKMALEVKIKGEKRLTEFLAPGDMKGTKVLVMSPSQMYAYLPAFGKVRRITNSVTDQGFLGLTFSQDDLATTTYTGLYTATHAGDTKLVLTPKAGQTPSYGKIELTIDKANMVPTEIKYFSTSGTHVKTETRSGYTCESGVCTPGELKMTDHTKGGQWTKLIRTKVKVNEAISDDVFSKRSLGE